MVDKTDNLLPLLQKIAAENNFKSCDIKVTPISTGGANYSSLLYIANISGDGHDDLRLFVKLALMGEDIRKNTELNLYDTERFVYTNLMTTYRRLEDQHGITGEHRMRFPKYYGADSTYLREVIVLEDLACQGFVLHDRMKAVDWEYAAAAVTQLAKFHALSIACAYKNPEQNTKFLNTFRHNIFRDNKGMQLFLQTGVKIALEVVREENKEKLKAFFDQYDTMKCGKLFDTNLCPVLLHGDYRPSNMMHRPSTDGTVKLIPVDYQTLQYGSPVIDLLYFIFTATDGSARAQFYDKLVAHYHSELGSALHRLGLQAEDVFPEDEFRLELKERLPYGLVSSVMLLPILTVAEKDAPKLELEMNFEEMYNFHTGDLYEKKLNEAVDEFVTLGVLV